MHKFGNISYRSSRYYCGATSDHIVSDPPVPDDIRGPDCADSRVGRCRIENEFGVVRNTFCMPVFIQLLFRRMERVLHTAGWTTIPVMVCRGGTPDIVRTDALRRWKRGANVAVRP